MIAAIKDDLQTRYQHVFLVDAGDHIQGTAYGGMDQGRHIIQMMNAAGYVMKDYLVLANYVQAFENGVVDAKNTPLLAKHPNLLIDYGCTEGSGRIEIVNDTGASDQNTSVSPQTNDTPVWNLFVVIILCGTIIPFTFCKKRI